MYRDTPKGKEGKYHIGGSLLPLYPIEIATEEYERNQVSDEVVTGKLDEINHNRQIYIESKKCDVNEAKHHVLKRQSKLLRPMATLLSFLPDRDLLRLAVTSRYGILFLNYEDVVQEIAHVADLLPLVHYRDPQAGATRWRRTRSTLQGQESIAKTLVPTKHIKHKSETWAEAFVSRSDAIKQEALRLAAVTEMHNNNKQNKKDKIDRSCAAEANSDMVAENSCVRLNNKNKSCNLNSIANNANGSFSILSLLSLSWLEALIASRRMSRNVMPKCHNTVRQHLRNPAHLHELQTASKSREQQQSAEVCNRQSLKFSAISCGSEHCIALACEGTRITDCLKNVFDKEYQSFSLKKVTSKSKAKNVAKVCGNNISVDPNVMYPSHCQRIFTWGSNSAPGAGMLGHQDMQSNCNAPRIAQLPVYSKSKNLCDLPAFPVQVAAGYAHSVMLLSNGVAYACGSTTHGQLGFSMASTDAQHGVQTFFRPILLPYTYCPCVTVQQKSIDVAAKSKDVATKARNKKNNHDVENASSFLKWSTRLRSPWVRVVQVAAGGKVTHLVTLAGGVWSFGFGGEGQLGTGTLCVTTKPTQVQTFLDCRVVVVFAAAGDGHSLFLTTKGRVFACGAGEKGQLGHGGEINEDTLFGARLRPVLLSPIPSGDRKPANVVYAACGYAHSLLVDSSGCIFSFGEGVRGRLGHGNEANYYVPTRITYFDHIQAARHNNLRSNNNNTPYTRVEEWNVVKVVQCAAGKFHSGFVTEDGRVYTCGLAMNLQLGHPYSEANRPLCVVLPQLVSSLHWPHRKCVQVECGDEFTTFLTEEGNMLANGLGTNGCCGVGDNIDHEEPSEISIKMPWTRDVDWTKRMGPPIGE